MTTMRSFEIEPGLQGVNGLYVFLNGSGMKGEWHFATGAQVNQTSINIDFDDPADAEPTWRKYQDSRLIGPVRG